MNGIYVASGIIILLVLAYAALGHPDTTVIVVSAVLYGVGVVVGFLLQVVFGIANLFGSKFHYVPIVISFNDTMLLVYLMAMALGLGLIAVGIKDTDKAK